MKLYHGTSEGRARIMLQQGIRPRGLKRGNSINLPSEPNHVYLTNTYGLHYAIQAADSHGRGFPAVVEIDVERLNPAALNADEDALEQTMRRRDDLPRDWSPERRVLHYRKLIAQQTYDWAASLDALGTCTHRGPIPAAAITGVAIIDHHRQMRLMAAALDAAVTVANQRFAAKAHKAALRWVFGEDTLPPELAPLDHGPAVDERLRWEFPWPPDIGRTGIELIRP